MADRSNAAPLIVSPHRVAWRADTPTKRTKRLWFDPEINRVVQMTRFDPDARLELHRHLGHEMVYVIEGDVTDEGCTVVAGEVSYRPTGCTHTVHSINGATALAIVTGGNLDAESIGSASQSMVYRPCEIPWTRDSSLAMSKVVCARHDDLPQTVLLRLDPGAILPRHRHIGEQFLFTLEGSYADESGEVRTGDFHYLPDGWMHEISSKNGATILCVTYGIMEKA